MKSARDEAGFTLLELLACGALATVMLLTLQSTLRSSIQSRQKARELESHQALAFEFLQRLTAIPFGDGSEPAVSAEQLTELFDDDDDFGTAVLRQVRVDAGRAGHAFATSIGGRRTQWRILVSNDLDGDGTVAGGREGRTDLLGIQIFADEKLMFRTVRAAPVENTVRD